MPDAQPTLADLQAQRDEIARKLAGVELPLIEQGRALLAADAVTKLKADITALVEQMPEGVARQQLVNVLLVTNNVPITLAGEHDRLSAFLAPPPTA